MATAQQTAAEPAHVAQAANLCNVYYFHTDQVGCPQALTNADGQLVWQATYKTWGSTLAEQWKVQTLAGQTPIDAGDKPGSEQNLRLQGQYLDRSSGLHYNTFRYYDPDIGRFICPDPIGLQGGINLATYAPNPISWIDPWGWCRRGNQKTRDHMDSVRDRMALDNHHAISHIAWGPAQNRRCQLSRNLPPPSLGTRAQRQLVYGHDLY